MAKFGHDHIVASRDDFRAIYCWVMTAAAEGISMRALSQLIVDDPVLRDQAKLLTTPTEKDIAATKTNMLISLQAAEFPFVQLQSLDCAGVMDGQPVPARIGLHGVFQEQQLT